MKKTIHWTALAACVLVASCAATHPALTTGDAAREQVIATERAFAKTMADRDFKAFGTFLSNETVFFGARGPQRGKQAVIDAWARFYEKPEAPFSWEPVVVEVLASGTLALSSGPVRNHEGKLIACYSSIWRQEAPGQWKIVFDRGAGPQECDKK